LEQYLRFFIDHRQKNWPEWLASAEFAVNNKVHLATKLSSFMANYGRELRIELDIRKKKKIKKSERVCKKDEEKARKSRGNIKESTEENEVTGR